MKKGSLVWNKKTADAKFSRKELPALLHAQGYDIRYCKKSKWDGVREEDELLIIAGDDRLIHKTIKTILESKRIGKQVPVAVLPVDEAGTFADILYNNTNAGEVIRSWSSAVRRPLDAGRIDGVEGHSFFIQTMGIGVMSRFLKKYNNGTQSQTADTEEALHSARELLAGIAEHFKAKFCRLEIDGKDYSGSYVLAEIVNMQEASATPGFAPEADPSDGMFEIVLLPAEQQQAWIAQLKIPEHAVEVRPPFIILRGTSVYFECTGGPIHIDGKLVKLKKGKQVHIAMQHGILEFLAQPSTSETKEVPDEQQETLSTSSPEEKEDEVPPALSTITAEIYASLERPWKHAS